MSRRGTLLSLDRLLADRRRCAIIVAVNSKHRKTLAALWAEPVNGNLAWARIEALLVTLGCFHFTEGSKKGGFGSFPMRLFNLPMNTRALVALPMIYGATAMVIVYLLCANLLLRHVGLDLPWVWPCLYLVFGLSQFQMILWSLPESRLVESRSR